MDNLSKSKKISAKNFLFKTEICFFAGVVISAVVAALRLKNISVVLSESQIKSCGLSQILFALCDGFFVASLIFFTLAIFSSLSRHNAFSAISFATRTFTKRFSKSKNSENTHASAAGQKQKETYFDFVRQNKNTAGCNWKIYLAAGMLFLFLSLVSFLLFENISSKL